MKFLAYILPSVFICLIFIAWQNSVNAWNEKKAMDLYKSYASTEETKANFSKAIGLLEYRNIWGHNVLVSPELTGSLFKTLGSQVEDKDEATRYLEKALQFYLHAANQKPAYGNNWALIAQLKWTLGQLDNDFIKYMRLAHKYGSYHYLVHVNLSYLALAMLNNEDLLSDEQQKIFAHHLNYGLINQRSSNVLKQNLNKQDKAYKTICGWLENSNDAKRKIKCS